LNLVGAAFQVSPRAAYARKAGLVASEAKNKVEGNSSTLFFEEDSGKR
jgi:hypothetical protein